MTTTNKLTLERFLALPETEPASEYACGEVTQKPMPGLTHYLLADFLQAVLRAIVRSGKLGRSGPELRCIFGPPGRERVFVPDIAFVSWQRLPRGSSRDTQRFHAAPDLAIEILSPDQPMGLFTEKVQFYLMYGVRLIWVVDPVEQTVTVLMPDAEPQTLTVDDSLEGASVLPGLTISMADLFAEMTLDPEE